MFRNYIHVSSMSVYFKLQLIESLSEPPHPGQGVGASGQSAHIANVAPIAGLWKINQGRYNKHKQE